MNQLPRAFRRDVARMDKFADLELCEGPQQTLQVKRLAREIRRLIMRWEHDPVCRAEGKAIPLFQSKLQKMGRSIEEFYLASLRELLSKWSQRFIQETIFQGEIITQQMIQISPTQAMVDELKAIVIEGAPDTYNPEKMYREGEKLADEHAEAYRAEWAEFKASWPERIDAAFLARLENLTIEDHNAWVAEISPETPKG